MKSKSKLLSNDSLFNGNLSCKQYKQGYRFSIDAVLVAHFCRLVKKDSVLDLGCGCGVIGLILAYRFPDITVTGLEIQKELADLARLNVEDNGLQVRISIVSGDICSLSQYVASESFDFVVCNPPYREPARGRVSAIDQRARARHEIDAELSDVINAASYGVKNRGRVVMVYPAERSMTLIAALKEKHLEPKRLQSVYSYPGRDASLVLVEAVKNGGEEVRILQPLYVYREKDGPYSDAVQTFYN